MSHVGEDRFAEDQVDEDLTIDEAGIATQLHTIDEIGAVVQEHDEQGGDEINLDDLNFNSCSAELADEVMTLEAMEPEVEIRTEEKPKPVAIPPLRPLTIAPKPAKLPVAFKPVTSQQLLLVQGAGAGQQIKLLSTTQGLNLSNISIAKPISIKQSPKANISLVSPKKVVMKKIVQKTLAKAFDGKPNQQIMVLQKSADSQVKFLPATTTKQLTLSDVQQMGLISSTKIIPHASKQIVVGKGTVQSKAIKLIPQLRPQTKILPAPQQQQQQVTTTGTKQPQRIYLKQASVTGATAAHILPGQIIQMPSGQAGQLHQINIPGKGMQYIKFITTTQAVDAPATAAMSGPKLPNKVSTPAPSVTSSTKPQLIKVGKPALAVSPSSATRAVPAGVVSRTVPNASPPKAPAMGRVVATTAKSSSAAIAAATGDAVVPKIASPDLTMESNGIKTRKPCNCAKSQCLKLYCDCFANGEFCFMCNCMNCYNNIENEEQRQRAIKNCLERNPNAFRPKIGKGKDTGEATIRKHTKGCNCKRSGCLKNYCECYEAKIACSNNCKCMGCMNVHECMSVTITRNLDDSRSSLRSDCGSYMSSPPLTKPAPADSNNKRKSAAKQPSNYINGVVIEATSQCLVSMARNAEEMGQSDDVTKKEIIEEFGRCLRQIIECTVKDS